MRKKLRLLSSEVEKANLILTTHKDYMMCVEKDCSAGMTKRCGELIEFYGMMGKPEEADKVAQLLCQRGSKPYCPKK